MSQAVIATIKAVVGMLGFEIGRRSINFHSLMSFIVFTRLILKYV